MTDISAQIPLRVYCRNCNTPAGFDILKQTYRCPGCGELTGIAEAGQAAAFAAIKDYLNKIR